MFIQRLAVLLPSMLQSNGDYFLGRTIPRLGDSLRLGSLALEERCFLGRLDALSVPGLVDTHRCIGTTILVQVV